MLVVLRYHLVGLYQWSHGSDSIMVLTKVRSLRGTEALEYL